MNYGIIAEFNPFHNGHKYLVQSVKKESTDTVTAVMSESFVQRGECAALSPYERTKMALLNGVDLVLSLPVQYAVSSAERFALGGVGILEGTGVIDKIAFGSECNKKSEISNVAKALLSVSYPNYLKKYLDIGASFPKARELAIKDMLGSESAGILLSPNDILGVEYVKAILKLNSSMGFEPVKRFGALHDSEFTSDNIASASVIRERLMLGESVNEFLPIKSATILSEAVNNNKAPTDFKKLENTILYKLRTMTLYDFSLLPDVSEGLEHKIYKAVKESTSVEEILEKVKTKRYTHSRLRRIIIYALLNITRDDVIAPAPYIRVLGFNENGAQLLKQMKEKSKLPVVTKPSDIKELSEGAQRAFYLECLSRDVFSLAEPKASACGKEMTDKIIVL